MQQSSSRKMTPLLFLLVCLMFIAFIVNIFSPRASIYYVIAVCFLQCCAGLISIYYGLKAARVREDEWYKQPAVLFGIACLLLALGYISSPSPLLTLWTIFKNVCGLVGFVLLLAAGYRYVRYTGGA
jgi:peptidoglycan/LPS O-acetylase OafA/YrhL